MNSGSYHLLDFFLTRYKNLEIVTSITMVNKKNILINIQTDI